MNDNIKKEQNKSNGYLNKIEHKFKNNPNLKFKYIITENNDNFGMNDIFEVYKLNKDKKGYIAFPNKNNFYLDIYNLLNNEKIFSLKEHQNRITSVRYFINNKDNSEYLISSDENKIVIVWDINENYNIKTKIDTKYGESIYSCLMIFPINENNNYIITSTLCCNDITKDSSENIKRAATKIYSLNQGEFFDFIKISVYYEIFYLLSWYDKKSNEYYVIQLNKRYVLLNNLKYNNSCKFLKQKNDDIICCGFIYNYYDNDYLLCSTKNGFINIWNLNNKDIYKVININKCNPNYIIEWNEKYIIISDFDNKSIKILDIENDKVISNIKGNQNSYFKCFKKVYHPIYGESLITADNDNKVKLWSNANYLIFSSQNPQKMKEID